MQEGANRVIPETGEGTEVKTAASEYPLRPALLYVLPHLNGDEPVLELGCCTGDLLEGFAKGSVGLDCSAEFLRKCRAKNFAVVRADLNDGAPFADSCFPQLLCSHVLEHVDSPVRVLRECHRVLKARGRIILGLPHEGWLVEMKHRYFDNHPYHLYSFSLRGISHLLRLAGFEIERYYFDLPTFLGPLLKLALPLAQVLPKSLVFPFCQSYWVLATKANAASTGTRETQMV